MGVSLQWQGPLSKCKWLTTILYYLASMTERLGGSKGMQSNCEIVRSSVGGVDDRLPSNRPVQWHQWLLERLVLMYRVE